MCDVCCGPNCSVFCDCLTMGIKTDFAKEISETFLMFLGSAAIEFGFNFGWREHTWISESVISSGISATYAVVISSFLRIMHHRNGEILTTDENKNFYTLTLISQLLSGAISFGVGIAFDLAFHEVLDNLVKNSDIAVSIAVPTVMITAQILSRIGIFKAVNKIKHICQQKMQYENLDDSFK
jgi:hypothetical protein